MLILKDKKKRNAPWFCDQDHQDKGQRKVVPIHKITQTPQP